MQNKNSLLSLTVWAIMLTAGIGILASCKKKFDEPPSAFDDPSITVTHSIREFKELHNVPGAFDIIASDIVISGTVVANDKSGNLYKEVYIQDSTGGLHVKLDALSLFATYPVGRKMYIKCKGLCLTDDNSMMVLGVKLIINGTPSLEGVPSQLLTDYVTGGSLNNPVVPTVVTVSQLGGFDVMHNRYLGTLIQLENYEFLNSDVNKTYADTSSYRNTQNLTIKNCSGGTSSQLIVRTSGFASFAGLNVPNGNGPITAVYTTFKDTKQLLVRDTADVKFYGIRCDGGGGGGGGPFISIEALRAMYAGSDVDITSNRIKGIVISDAINKNVGTGNIILQDGNRGIALFFGSSAASAIAAFHPGDSLVVDISGGTLTSFNGSLEVSLSSSAVPVTAAGLASAGAGLSATPKVVTIADLKTNISSFENTLVKIVGAKATGNATYSGNNTLTDASGNMLIRTVSSATFASAPLPTTCQDWTGFVNKFNTDVQLFVRNPATDVVVSSSCGVTPPPGGGIQLTTSPFVLDFNGITGGDLPDGVSVKTGASSTELGSDAGFLGTAEIDIWSSTRGGFKDYASATGLVVTSDSATQVNHPNRALGVRQVGNTSSSFPNGDPGIAFVFQIENTTGKSNLQLNFLLQSLDAVSSRTTTWSVDYATGDNPTTFTKATTTGTLTTGGTAFSSNPISATFGGALDNQAGKVWIRIVALDATTGTGTRASTGIDDFTLTW